MIARALRLGTAFFGALLCVVAVVLAAVFWHHQSVSDPARPMGAPEVHTDLIFAFPFSPLALVAGAVAAWLVCVAAGYLWLDRRK